MSADVLSDDLKSRLHLTTKTVGQERIRRARENNEDVAILSMFLPNATADRENKKFCCSLREECLLGDPRKTIAGVVGYFTRFLSLLGNTLKLREAWKCCDLHSKKPRVIRTF